MLLHMRSGFIPTFLSLSLSCNLYVWQITSDQRLRSIAIRTNGKSFVHWHSRRHYNYNSLTSAVVLHLLLLLLLLLRLSFTCQWHCIRHCAATAFAAIL